MNENYEIEEQIRIARKALATSIEAEEASGYHADYTMERKYEEGFLDALEFIYTLNNGYPYIEEAKEEFCTCEQDCLKKQCKMTLQMIKYCECAICFLRREAVANKAGKITITKG